ncbi:MAG TPA: lysophospholipid acyltransferase family protein [Ilumatobacteraceae bacterium]|nr:lysophospholipid acyltransferase family protein [Ilumatobacteraceae bacterium]
MSRVVSRLAGGGFASRISYQIARAIAATITRLYTRMSIDGREHIPRSGGFVLAPVHRSYVDTPIACCVTRRRLRYMGKDTLWRNRAFGWLLSALGGFPVTRGTADREALRRCIEVLGMGEVLVLYPEGERKDGPIVQPLFDGAAYVAAKAGVPIVPVGIGGSDRVMPRGARFVYPRKVYVVIGPPIPAPIGAGERLPRVMLKEHSDRLHTELQRLYDEAQRRVGAQVGSDDASK